MATGVGGEQGCEDTPFLWRPGGEGFPVRLPTAGGAEAREVHASRQRRRGQGERRGRGHVKPLPAFGAVVSVLGRAKEEGVVLRVRVEEDVRSSWVGRLWGLGRNLHRRALGRVNVH